MKKRLILVITLVCLISGSAALSSIGTSPSVINAGTIERGSSKEVTFYITSDGDQPYRLDAFYVEPFITEIFEDSVNIDRNEISEENIRGWLDFKDSYLIDPRTEEQKIVDGTPIVSEGNITVEINVPEDAEPGYHIGRIGMNPQIQAQDTGVVGANNVVISQPQFIFRVPGDAERQIQLSDVQGFRIGNNIAQVILQFRNSGTVTTTLKGKEISIVNQSSNKKVGEILVDGGKIPPDDFRTVDAIWRGPDVRQGIFQLDGNLGFYTGKVPIQGSFPLTDSIQEAVEIQDQNQPGGRQPDESGGNPLLLVVMFLVLAGAVLYSLDIDPFWVVLVIGFLGASAFILMTGLPSWLIILLILGVGGVIYVS